MTDEGKRGIQGELFHAETDREPGDNNWQGYGFDINPPVFLIAGGLIILFIILSLAFPDQAGAIYQDTRIAISDYFDWLFILAANIFIIFMVYLAISKYGAIRLGGVDGEKEFSDISWIAMLFSAGMGIGLMFFGVAEPVYHLFDPHLGAEAGTDAAAEVGMAVSLFHWGFHPWAIYALVALGLAFFSYNRGLPLTFRSVFYPVLGERIYGWPGHVIDIFTVFATLFGLVTSLGLGALQINAGLTFVGDEVAAFPAVPDSVWVAVGIVTVVTGLAIISVYLGLDKGIRRLSNLNLTLMLVLLASVFILGPTLFILGALPQGIGAYIGSFFELSFFGNSFDNHYFQGSEFYGPGGDGEGGFLVDWTVFYWAWWISWSPFVGMFIARISKGRTIREFVGGVLLIPVVFSFAWFAAMGGTALNFELNEATAGAISGPTFETGEELAMFAMFDLMPGTVVLSVLAIILVTTFFVTSSDSGSLVLEHLSTGGKHETPATGRVFWAASEGLVASTLLIAGGDAAVDALQAAAIASGLPFAVILLFMIYAVMQGLKKEYRILQSNEFEELIDDLEDQGEIVVTTETGDLVTEVKTRDDRVINVGSD
ncbi:BCCT family transporter [Natrarchaeobaculum sulfurireducens]|uniref:Choline-glycine betaine transporter n=1 Tax=Natrarchaeobaculum sulfurireducens TaxID=2044521 RepID=A0A346PBE4_9EURY|nr:BCCT family transporter [Natrarchaeobaculum sulfurireducens]AXR76839.1 Choline-glycine betaine transporter [Natrarchaeobaculum sulfurireducens]AXR80507.1 High-affinity choline uptake protein BetT [Natrarchaeobaculum sulfurireducens]